MDVLKQEGYRENEDLFLVPYDWRQPITDDASQLASFVQSTIWDKTPYKPISLIGHSLGGIVARIFGEQNKTKPIKKIISVGSPLLGTAQGYKALAAGEIDRSNTLMWLAQKIVLELNRKSGEEAKDTIVRVFPVLQDLTPTFPFLTKTEGTPITSIFTNYLLVQYPLDTHSSLFARIGGIGHNALVGYTTTERTQSDVDSGIYPDGRPSSSLNEDGDGFIPLRSTGADQIHQFTGTHGQTIYGEQFINDILSLLDLPSDGITVPPGSNTPIFPALFVFVQSPATATVQSPDGLVTDESSSLHLSNISSGVYTVTLTGTGAGSYTLHTWLIGESADVWQTFTGTTAEGQKDIYKIAFDTSTGGKTTVYVEPSPTVPPSPTLTPTAHTEDSSSTSTTSSPPSSSTSSNPTGTPYVQTASSLGTIASTDHAYPLLPSISYANKEEVLGTTTIAPTKRATSKYLFVIGGVCLALLILSLGWSRGRIRQLLQVLWSRLPASWRSTIPRVPLKH